MVPRQHGAHSTVYNNSMGNARPHIPFSCPICQHDEFVPVRVKTREGGMRLTQSYECRGCSVVFRDPWKFTRYCAEWPKAGAKE